MSQQGPVFNHPTQAQPGRSQNSQSSYGSSNSQPGGRGSGNAGRGRADSHGRELKRGGGNVGNRGGPFQDHKTDSFQLENFQVDSNGGGAARNPAQLGTNGPPGGALTFGSFTELPSRQLPNAESQTQNGPGMAQQHSGSLSQGPSQQMPHQQQQQGQRRGSGPRNSQGYKGPNHYDSSHAGQPGGIHPNAAFNFMAGAGPGNYMPQQAYSYQQAHYYQNNMMMPQGGFQQPAYSAPQPPSRNHQQAQGYQRPQQSQPGRPVAMAPSQSSHPSAAAVPPMQKKPSKAIAIIDPDTHTHVIVSPRGSGDGGGSEQGSAKPTPTSSPQKDLPAGKPAASKGLIPTKPADKEDAKKPREASSSESAASKSAEAAPAPIPATATPAASTADTEALQLNQLPSQDSSSTPPAPAQQSSQQPALQASAKASVSAKDSKPAGAQQQQQSACSAAAAKTAGQEQQQQQQQQQPDSAAKQSSSAAVAKTESAPSSAGGAWGGIKSFRDIAAGTKPDKSEEDKRRSDEAAAAKRKGEEAERKAEADRQTAADKAEAQQKIEAERQAEADRTAAADKAAADKAQQEAEQKRQAAQESEQKQKAEREAAAKAEERKNEQREAEEERLRKQKADRAAADKAAADTAAAHEAAADKAAADKAAADKAAAEAKQKAEAEAKQRAEIEAKQKAEAEAKQKADEQAKQEVEAEAKRKAEADRQAESEQKAASKKEAIEKAERARKEGAAKEEAADQKKKDEQAKAAKVKAEEGSASPSKEQTSAPPPTSSSLSAKQKRKDMMKRAEEKDTAAGYEDPFQPKQPAAVEPSTPAARGGAQPVSTEAESSGRSASGDVDDDDWEQTADRTPRGPNAPQGSAQASTSGRKAYTLDWMLRQQDQPECQSLPSHFEAADLIAMGWRSQMGPGQGGGFDGPPTRVPGGGRGHPGMGGGGRGMGRGPVMPPPGVPVDKWQQQGPMAPMPGMDMRGGRGGAPGGMGGPGRGGPMGKPGGNMEGDRWGKRALPPPPPGSGGGAIAGLPALHKTDNKFKIGQVEGDNPEEIKKQKAIKGSLNKITPEKFDKILADIIAVGYETEATESGLIDQVFDKALTETTFCEIYADLCFQLNSALPSFEPPSQDATKRPPSTFRKQLLNKCQEEFEKGAAAMEAVEAREKAEQGKTKEEKEQDQAEAAEASGSEEEAPAEAATSEEEREEGEIVPPATPVDKKAQRLQARRAAAQAAADELKARQRALGNIQFIGHLYRKKMLTEKIMHECIKKLLADVEAPKQEDLECLAKLMSTVGRQLDTAKAQMYMNAYFERVAMLSKNMSLESRIRFMLQDLIELRRNAWVARREVEGPKKIDQVHADARRDDANRARAAAGGPNMRGNRGGGDYRGGGGGLDSYGGPPQRRMPSRHDSMIDSPVRPMQRNSSQDHLTQSFRPGGGAQGAPSLSLRPGGAASGAMLSRSGSIPNPTDNRGGAASRGPAGEPERAAPATAPAQPPAPVPKKLSREELENKVRGTLEEYFFGRDKAELTQSVKDMLALTDAAQIFEQIPLVAVSKMRGVDWTIITEVMTHLCTGDQPPLPKAAVLAGASSLLNTMGVEDVMGEAPKAADWVGGVLGALVSAGLLPLKQVATATVEAAVAEEGEDGQLVDGGSAWKLMGAVLQAIAQNSNQAQMSKQWQDTGLQLDAFFPAFEKDDAGKAEAPKLQAMAKTYGLQALVPKPDIKPHIQEAIAKGDKADSMLKWVVEQQGPDAMKDPNLAKQITLVVLRQAIPNPKGVNTDEKVESLSSSEICGDLLTITSSKGGLKAEVATILGAQQFFHESGAPKKLMQRLLEDLVDCGSVTYEAVQHWQHDNRDVTPGKEAAIKDSAKLVASLAEKDAENTDINN